MDEKAEIFSPADRAQLAFEALMRRDEQAHAASGGRYGATEADVRDVADDYSTGSCPTGCEPWPVTTCCDRRRVSALLWILVEQAFQCDHADAEETEETS